MNSQSKNPAGDTGDRPSEVLAPQAQTLRVLRTRVLSRLLVVALVPLFALMFYLRFQFISTIEARSELLLQTIAESRQNAIDQIITNKSNALRSISNLIEPERVPSRRELVSLLGLLQSLDETILDIGLFDENGTHTRYAGPFPSLEGKNYAGEEWFRTLSTTDRELFVSDVYLGYRNELHFIVASRIAAAGGIRFIRLTVNPVRFNELVNDVQVLEGARALIVNRDGICQCGPPEMVNMIFSPLADLPAMSESQGVGQVRHDGADYLAAWSRMETADWTLVVLQDLAVANLPARSTTRVGLVILALSTLVIVVMSVLSTQTLLNRYARAERQRARLIDHLIQAGRLSTMGEMAAGVAHEINNPLAVMLSEVGVMEDVLDPAFDQTFDREEFRQRMDSIKQEIRRCRDITQKLLGFSRHHETRIEPHDINGLARESVDLIRREFSFDNIEVRFELADDLPPIETDAEKMKQVFVNLLRNARDAIGKGGRITISSRENTNTISLVFTDTGCGIAPEDLSRIFQPFYTTKEVGKGTGLGLSISHGIVTSLGGVIQVSSRVGEGTMFEIELPK